MKILQHLPNALTLSNLMMGTIAVFLLQQSNYSVVLLLVGGCLVADILDGALARKLGVAGGLGIQLDSLADVVSFGVLPAFIVYSLPVNASETLLGRNFHLILSALIAVSAGLRLARFNVDTRPREFFWGLATPAGGIMVTALGWSVLLRQDFMDKPEMLNIILVLLPIFLAILYQVPLKLPGLKSPRPGIITMVVITLLTVIGFIVIGPISVTLGIFLYVVMGILNLLIKWY